MSKREWKEAPEQQWTDPFFPHPLAAPALVLSLCHPVKLLSQINTEAPTSAVSSALSRSAPPLPWPSTCHLSPRNGNSQSPAATFIPSSLFDSPQQDQPLVDGGGIVTYTIIHLQKNI